ncbi:MAG: phosphate ABC transporter permease subunit PstC [Acidimicrobiia bacterium]
MTAGIGVFDERRRVDAPRRIVNLRQRSDRIYRALGTTAGLATLLLLVVIGWFLLQEGLPALRQNGLDFITGTRWTDIGPFGIAAVMYWTVVIAVIALVLALPFSIAAALFINEYAPAGARRFLVSVIDLLAAVPSILFGLWGLTVLQPHMQGVSKWISTHLDFVPFFQTDSSNLKSSPFIAGVVVALMITPIITSIVREVFSQAPAGEKEAALAMGATRWGMIRTVVLPFGRGGIIGGAMLGLGRALGETIAVVLIISPSFVITRHILQSGGNSVASLIANRIGDAHGIAVNALMAAGLALFVMTLLVNMVASFVVARSRSGTGVEL